MGLELLSLLQTQRGRQDGTDEPTKPVIQTSLSIALTRCCVHILPVLVSITVISLNLGGLYLGTTIPGAVTDNSVSIAIFQVLAKLQELLIIASLATIVFEVVRGFLISGDGVPLGFLGSGFMFSQISYFWSPDFWGALGARIDLRQKLFLATLLLVSGLIAATAGPSCAVLLIPREQEWNAGGSKFYLRGLANELHPTFMSASIEPESFCADAEGINYAVCPSGGFHALRAYSSFLPMIQNSVNLQSKPISVFGLWATQKLKMASTMRVVPGHQLTGLIRGVVCQTSASGPYLPVAMYQNKLREDWYALVGNLPWTGKVSSASAAEYRWNNGDSLRTATRVPVVRVACSEGQNKSAGVQKVRFPVLSRYSCWQGNELSKSVQLNNTGTNQIRTTWVPLSSDFGTVSSGIVFEAPWTQDQNSRVVVGCSVDARWSNGNVDKSIGLLADQADQELWGGRPSETSTEFRPHANSSWTEISLEKSWLDLLTPHKIAQSTLNNDSSLNTLENILTNSAIVDATLINSVDQTETWNNVQVGGPNRTIYLEWILSLLVTDGLVRQGSSRALNTSGSMHRWSLLDYSPQPDFENQILTTGQALKKPSAPNITTFDWRIIIKGFSYKASSSTDYLSISVLVGHIILALAHTFWLISKRQSSGCWDTITELVTLAQNSGPAHSVLRNTSTGIKCKRTFAQVAKVRVVRRRNLEEEEPETTSPARVEIVFYENKNSLEEDYWPTSEEETVHVSSSATWPLAQREAAASSAHCRATPEHSISSSRALLLPSLRGIERRSDGSVYGSHGGPILKDFDIVHPDRLYS